MLQGFLYTPLAALIIGRDIFLVVGASVLRLRSFGGSWPGWKEFFRTTNTEENPNKGSGGKSKMNSLAGEESRHSDASLHAAGDLTKQKSSALPATYVQPLYVSKLNTVAQILLVAGCITSTSYAWPAQEVLLGLGGVTAGLTLASGIAYVREHKSKQDPQN